MPDDLPSVDQSLSLLFRHDGPSVSLVDARIVDVASPASEDTGPLTGEPGFWYELRDVADNVMWRNAAPHPIWLELEAPSDENGEMTWAVDPTRSGGFVAQVPIVLGAVTLALVGSPPPGADPGPVQELAVFGLGAFV